MPAEYPADPTLLHALAGVLTRSSNAAFEASNELLAHYSDTGDAPTQQAVDSLLDHAADALRSLTDCLAEASGELRTAAAAAGTDGADGSGASGTRSHRATTGSAPVEMSRIRPRPGREGSR